VPSSIGEVEEVDPIHLGWRFFTLDKSFALDAIWKIWGREYNICIAKEN